MATQNKPIWLYLFILVMLITVLFPMVRIKQAYFFPIRLDFFLIMPVLFLALVTSSGRFLLHCTKRKLYNIFFIIYIYVLSIYLSVIMIRGVSISIKDIFYPSVIMLVAIYFLFYDKILGKISIRSSIKMLKIIFFFELLVALFQTLNLFNINEALLVYFSSVSTGVSPVDYASFNVTQSVGYIRAIGTLGFPTFFAFFIYLIGRTLYTITNSRVYLIASLIGIFLAGGRTMLLVFVIFEMIIAVYFAFKKKRLINALSFDLMFFAVIVLLYLFPPFGFIKAVLGAYSEGLSAGMATDPSVTVRLEIYRWLFSNPERVLFGGMTAAEIYSPIINGEFGLMDSEIVITLAKFGLIGLMLHYVWIFYPLLKKFKSREDMLRYKEFYAFLAIIAIVMSLTNFSVTNLTLIPWLVLSILIVNKYFSERSMINSKIPL